MNIDKEVAEKIMGWKISIFVGKEYWDGSTNKDAFWVHDWSPSTRIDHALMVLDKFDMWLIEKANNSYACSIHPKKVSWYKWYATVPLAICMAALETVK